ncbi:MAG TPA: AAA family ATPase [Thermoleophilaceae bacterium]|nr:AAA family ATPase [Thermoleophilaceae bacterium]
MTSARVVGRGTELAELEAALADSAAGKPSIVFVAGESGVGKTRLLAEFERRARASSPPARVIGGDCVELGEGELPYAPLVAALRPLAREQDPVVAALPEATRGELGALVPGLAPARSEPQVRERDDAAQARLFEALLTLFDALGSEGTLLLSIEDIHWADRSTRAFLSFLARSLCGEHVLVVCSYRPDELHRRHPLRPLLAELERNSAARRIELPTLSRDELREQLADILGAAPDADLVERMWARSEGNPLFTEELLAAGLDGRGTLPPTLRDALMVRIERLSEEAQELLRVLAAGRRLDESLLADASGMEQGALRAALREVVASHIVAAGDDGFYRFRHALLREVVHDDLLPGEHAELHLALAKALERRVQDQGSGVFITAGIAHHYFAAGEQAAALAASVEAADAAENVHAHGEAAALLERALELWDRVPNAEELAGRDRVGLLWWAATDHRADGDFARAETLARRALDGVDENEDPYRAAGIMELIARAEWSLIRSADAIETALQALALLPAGDKSRERARLLSFLAKCRMLQGRYKETLELAEEAIEAAEGAPDPLAESRARNARGIALASLGDVDAGTAELRRAVEIALEREYIGELHSAYANLADALHLAARTREGFAVLTEGQATLTRISQPVPWLNLMMGEFQWALGNWRAAEAVMPASERRQGGTRELFYLILRATMDLAYADEAGARQRLARAEPIVAESTEPQYISPWGVLMAELYLREGDVDSAREVVERSLDRIEFCTEDLSRIVRLAAVGVAVEAEAAERCRDLGEDPSRALLNAEMMLARVQAASAEGDWPVEHAWLVTGEAQMQRARGESDPAAWHLAAEAWDAIERPYEAALSRWRQAEALAFAGDREGAAELASVAIDAAHGLGAIWLENELLGLVARARLRVERAGDGSEPAETPAVEEEDPFGLTPRERQVLALLAEGMTNREIGDTLFMAEKTASVHVSRILSKLDVRSRTQAAALAHRLGLEREQRPTSA